MLSADPIYVQIFADRFVVTNADTGQQLTIQRDMSHASRRMLIADFTTAEQQLKDGVRAVRRRMLAPHLVMHPMELIEGGVTQVEHRVFRELAQASGATRVAIHVGQPLDAVGVRNALVDTR